MPSFLLGLQRYFRPPRAGSIRLGHLFPLNDPDIPTLVHRSSGSRSFSDISFAPSFLALSCSWEVLQDLGSDHLPILLSVPLSPVFRSNERPLPSIFRKLAGMTLPSTLTLTVLLQRILVYSSLSLCSAVAFFTSLALNAAKSSIPFGRIKRSPKAWWSAEVESAVNERCKAFAAAHKSDEDRQAYISASRRASSVIAKSRLRHGRRLAFLFHPNLTLNVYTLFFALSLALLPRLLPHLTSPIVLLPGNRLWSMPLT